MDFANGKDQKFVRKTVASAIARKAAIRYRALVLDMRPTKVAAGKIKSQRELLDFCGLANEYRADACFVMLASKLEGTAGFRLPYAFVFCSLGWEVTRIVTRDPDQVVAREPNEEYVFVMAPNLVRFLQISEGDRLRV